MKRPLIEVLWPDGQLSLIEVGSEWLCSAYDVGIVIPTGCLGGSCGACEIEVNGQLLRACISTVAYEKTGKAKVEFATDPLW